MCQFCPVQKQFEWLPISQTPPSREAEENNYCLHLHIHVALPDRSANLFFWLSFGLAVTSAWLPHGLMCRIKSERMFILHLYESQDSAFCRNACWRIKSLCRPGSLRKASARAHAEGGGSQTLRRWLVRRGDWGGTLNNSQLISMVFYAYHSWLVLTLIQCMNLHWTLRPCTGAWCKERGNSLSNLVSRHDTCSLCDSSPLLVRRWPKMDVKRQSLPRNSQVPVNS